MTDPFQIISTYFWLIGLVFGVVNYVVADRRLNASGDMPAEREAAARGYLRRFALFGALPLAVMGAGQLTGATPTVWYYFRPQDLNPYVIAEFGLIFLQACFLAWWVFFADGARKIMDLKLMGVLDQSDAKPVSERGIKWMAALGPVFLIFWIVMVAAMDAPLPK